MDIFGLPMKKSKGASLAQYSIVLAVLSVSVIAVYGFLGQRTNSILLSYLGIFTANNAKVQSNAALLAQKGGSLSYTVNTIPAGSMGGTPDVPVQACVSGACTIDFGSYILSGVPEDFQEVVKNTGTSGGLDNIVDLMMQIADQIEQKGDIAGAQQFRDMANLGHFFAIVDKEREKAALSCLNDYVGYSDSKECYQNKSAISENLAKYKPDFINISEYHYSYSIDIGYARSLKGSFVYTSGLNHAPEYNFVDLYDKIQDNSSFPSELKGISTELYLMVASLQQSAEDVSNIAGSTTSVPNRTFQQYDPITGAQTTVLLPLVTDLSVVMQNIYSPNFATGQHFNSSLICAAGKNVDIQDSCHK